MNTLSRSLLSVLLVLTLGVIGVVRADEDPPERVGRLSYLSGEVSFLAKDQDEWTAAELNYPVIGGDSFWTEPDARAELGVGSAEIRLDSQTQLQLVDLDDTNLQLRLTQGALNLHLTELDEGYSYEVLTPRGTVSLLNAGDYHIDAGTTDEPTRITVLEGAARLATTRSDISLHSGDSAVVTGLDPVSYAIEDAQATRFDEWAQSRDQREAATQSVRYVSPQTTGYNDLDRYGHWSEEADNGPLWYPDNVPSDWAPYRYGHWADIAPWGNTWVDDEPWGFAPSHYGRWANVHGRWGWSPGEVAARPVFAPALVAFVAGVALGTQSHDHRSDVGWFPLAPGEPYLPTYRSSDNYRRNINRGHVRNITINNVNINKINYINLSRPEAVTMVHHDTFINAGRVAPARFKPDRTVLASAQLLETIPKIEPRKRGGEHGPRPKEARIQGLPMARGEVHARPVPLPVLSGLPGLTQGRANRESRASANAFDALKGARAKDTSKTDSRNIETPFGRKDDRKQDNVVIPPTPVREAQPLDKDKARNEPERRQASHSTPGNPVLLPGLRHGKSAPEGERLAIPRDIPQRSAPQPQMSRPFPQPSSPTAGFNGKKEPDAAKAPARPAVRLPEAASRTPDRLTSPGPQRTREAARVREKPEGNRVGLPQLPGAQAARLPGRGHAGLKQPEANPAPDRSNGKRAAAPDDARAVLGALRGNREKDK